jgi:hypothetical protein
MIPGSLGRAGEPFFDQIKTSLDLLSYNFDWQFHFLNSQ